MNQIRYCLRQVSFSICDLWVRRRAQSRTFLPPDYVCQTEKGEELKKERGGGGEEGRGKH
jgi:hypothetical protein